MIYARTFMMSKCVIFINDCSLLLKVPQRIKSWQNIHSQLVLCSKMETTVIPFAEVHLNDYFNLDVSHTYHLLQLMFSSWLGVI
jgi:hypothetical protein